MTTETTPTDDAVEHQPDPEHLALVVRIESPDDVPARFVLVRDADDGPLRLLDVAMPGSGERVEEAVGDVLRTRLGVEPAGAPLSGHERRPRRTARWREGHVGTGWVRAVALTVVGELDPVPPLTALEVLPLDEAETALTTSLERALLHDGAALLDG